jgi:hypothetical protein
MFERIVETAPGNRTLTAEERQGLLDNNMTEYSVVVLSRPSTEPVVTVSKENDELPPWVIVLENFVTDEESETMIEVGYQNEYKRSHDVGVIKTDGTHESVESSRRTSENAWCTSKSGCRMQNVPQRLLKRMSKVLVSFFFLC